MTACHGDHPDSTAPYTTNRACAPLFTGYHELSEPGVQGRIDCGIGAGVESMTRKCWSKGHTSRIVAGTQGQPDEGRKGLHHGNGRDERERGGEMFRCTGRLRHARGREPLESVKSVER